jgi:hypothetical protein
MATRGVEGQRRVPVHDAHGHGASEHDACEDYHCDTEGPAPGRADGSPEHSVGGDDFRDVQGPVHRWEGPTECHAKMRGPVAVEDGALR